MNDENQQDLEVLEIDEAKAKHFVKRMEALERLTKNKDFIAIIHEGYFKDESSRLVLLKGDSCQIDDSNQKSIDNQIIGIGQLYQYFQAIMFFGLEKQKALKEYEMTREDILSEEAGN